MQKRGLLFRAGYHWVVSINRPSGYEPDALPLRHNDVVSLGGFDPPPLTLRSSVRFHYATMTWGDMCTSFAHIRHRLHCVHLPNYHRVVSVHRPSGYEPDALPLRHDDFICTAHRI